MTTRVTTTPHARALAEKGAELVQISSGNPFDDFMKAFEGADAVVNLLGRASPDYEDAVGEAAIKSGVAVYFPSEYGSCVVLPLTALSATTLRLTSTIAITGLTTSRGGRGRSGSSKGSTCANTAS